jgi:hypothetical protein
MEYGIYALIAAAFSAIGGVTGVLVGRNNPGSVEKIIANVKAEIARSEKKAAELKAQLAAQGIKV